MAMDFRGDPAAALLEVLDPEQNSTFSDHYIELPFDLSNVMFITTANAMHNIPRPLLDRMEVLYIPGYTELEKLEIAERYLLPKQKRDHGLEEDQLEMDGSACMRSSANIPAKPACATWNSRSPPSAARRPKRSSSNRTQIRSWSIRSKSEGLSGTGQVPLRHGGEGRPDRRGRPGSPGRKSAATRWLSR